MKMSIRAHAALVLSVLTGLLPGFLEAQSVQTNYYYVVSSNDSAQPPYRSWAAAATNIQSAVDAAQAAYAPGTSDCIVLVSNGTYTLSRPIAIATAIRLAGFSGDPDDTIINGGYPASTNRCLIVAGDTWVSGFTISNGFAYGEAPDNQGGGVYMTTNGAGQGGLISNCRIVNNQARMSPSMVNGQGCGVYINRSGTVSNCLISGNASDKANGGGVYLNYGGRAVGCQIVDNTGNTGATTYGGGVYFSYGGEVADSLIARNETRHAGGVFMDHGGEASRCSISNNYAGNGKGAYLSYGGTLRDCVVERNVAGYTSGSGGGILIDRTGALVDRCVVRYNMASSAAGISHDRSTVRNTLVYGNQASGTGGGVVSTAFATTILENTTVVRNSAGSGGGVVVGTSSSAPYGGDVRNVICVDNTAADSTNNVLFVPYTGYDLAANNRFVFSCVTPVLPGAGNIAADPLFVDAGSGSGTNAVTGDYGLQTNSPCIGTGTNQSWMTGVLDQPGNARLRPSWGVVDMGACEAYPMQGSLTNGFTAEPVAGAAPLPVTFTAETSGNTNGIRYRWVFGDATTHDWSGDGVVLHAYAARTIPYTVTMSVSNDSGDTASRTMTEYIRVYPAFVHVATNGQHAAPFDTWEKAATNIQSAVDVAGGGYSTVLVGDGLYTVLSPVTISNAVTLRSFGGNPTNTVIRGGYPASTNRCLTISGAGAVVDGFTITNGNANLSYGGGVYMTAASTVRNCIIIGNTTVSTAAGIGGGIAATAGSILNCEIRNNSSTASGGGGGVFANGAGVVVRNCLVAGNRVTYSGGGIRLDAGLVENCIVSNNAASVNGGGFMKANTSAAICRNCLIAGNQAGGLGGGVYGSSSGLGLHNCTIVGNLATNGGGIYSASAVLYATNCIVVNNTALQAGGTNDISGLSTNFGYSCSPLLGPWSGNTSADPQFVKAGSGYGLSWTAGDYRLRAGSPCLDTGVVLSWMAGAPDLAGAPRIQGAGPAMGAYETETAIKRSGAMLMIR